MKTGDELELGIEKAVYRGLGLARHEGQVVFVPRSYGGDRVRAVVEEVGRGYVRARSLELLEPAPGRRAAPCRHAPRCGGCAYQDIGYAEQLRIKEAILRESLSRAHVAWERELEVAPSPETGWRTRAELHLAWQADGPRLGFHEEGSRELVDVEACLQLSPELLGTARELAAALSARGPLGRRVSGLELAESSDGSERVACLVSDLRVSEAAALSALGGAGGTTGLLVVAGGEPRPTAILLRGSPFVHADVAGLRFRAHQQSFFQGNRFLLETLVDAVLAALPAGGPALDLYAGVGLFALPLAARGDAVRGVEINRLAVADAVANAEAAGLRDVRFDGSDVEAALRALPAREDERVVLDPPRSGVARGVVQAVAARRPAAVAYVSCDPPTLGRDLRLFADLGYHVSSLRALDLFPDTFHVESVARLEPD